MERTWPELKKKVTTKVVYPCVDIETKKKDKRSKDERKKEEKVFQGEKIILSINRFERKKDIGLAIKAFAAIPEEKRKGVRLILAGMLTP